MLSFVGLLVSAFCLYGLVYQLGRGRRYFSDRDMRAFRKAERLRKELKDVEAMVGPKPPDHSVTLGIKSNK